MRSSRRSSRASRGLALTLLVVAAGAARIAAHRTDEYLQAARIAIAPERVDVDLDLTPGIALADAVVADIDRDRDGSLSAAEQQAYGREVLSALELEVDGTRLPLGPGSAPTFPEVDAVQRGEGTIRLRLAATLPRLSAGVHHLWFRNRHHPDRSVYLANALVPASSRVAVTAQSRDRDQTELTIDYVLRAAPPRPAAAWLVGGLAAMTALAALLMRPLRAAK